MAAPPRRTMTYAEILALARAAGFKAGADHTIAAIALAESTGDTHARSPVTVREDSRGVLQINLKAHGATVSEDCAFTPECAMAFAYKLSQGGTKFTDWSVYTNGRYKQFLQSNVIAEAEPGGPISNEQEAEGGDGGLEIDGETMTRFWQAFAGLAVAAGLVALGAWGIVSQSGKASTVVKVIGKVAK